MPSRGDRVVIAASTANVPLPWIGTQVWDGLSGSTPAIASMLLRTRAVISMKSVSREPQSFSMASFTEAEVVSGPGVRRRGVSEIRVIGKRRELSVLS